MVTESASSAWVAGQPASFDAALDAAAQRLGRSRLPLVCGLTHLTVEALRETVRLAELLGAVIDPGASAAYGPGMVAFQQSGRLTATLGEVQERADVVVCWGVDPDAVHPGFLERYVGPAEHAPGRTIVAVDVGDAAGPEQSHERYVVAPEREFEAVWALRALLRTMPARARSGVRRAGNARQAATGRDPAGGTAQAVPASLPGASNGTRATDHAGRGDDSGAASVAGGKVSELAQLAARLESSRYVVILCDGDPPPERRDPLRIAALSALVFDVDEADAYSVQADTDHLTAHVTRARLLPIRASGNVVGAENVLTWQTGYPFAVHFGRGYPRYGPDEFTAEALLQRGDTDTVLLAGADPAVCLSASALDTLHRVPTVVVGPADRANVADVWIETAAYDEVIGSVYRMDGVPLRHGVGTAGPPSRAARPSPKLVLERLTVAVHAARRGRTT